MTSPSFRVVIARFDEERKDELVDELSAELDISRSEAADALRTLPLTVARGLDEEDAEELADLLEESGAKVRIVEVAARRRRRPGRARDEVAEPPEREEDEEPEEEDEEEDLARRPPARRTRRSSQKVLIAAGGAVVVLLIAVVVLAAVGVDFSALSCSGGFRGPGANVQLEQTLTTFAERFARGFRPDDAVAHGTLANKQVATLREHLTGPACYVWIGLSQQGSDLDLHLRRDGTVITEDRGEDNYPVVRHCVTEPGVYELDVEMFNGTSDWVVQRYVLSGQAGTDILEQMHALYAGQFIANAEPVDELRRVKQLGPGQDRVIPVKLEPRYCYAVLAVSNPGTDLDASIENSRGQKIAEDSAVDNYPILRDICPTEEGEYQLHLIMYTGTSEVVYRIYRGALGGSVAPSGARQPQPLKLGAGDGGAPTPAGDAGPQPQADAAPPSSTGQ